MDDIYYMNKALEQAKIAYKQNEVPIGCVIVKNNEIISVAYNKKEINNVSTHHAEILAINDACSKLNTWHLEECTLYTTVEPCMMCTGAIIQSRISKVVYGTNNYAFGYLSKIDNNKIIIKKNILKKECLDILSKFFQEQRNSKEKV